MERAGAEHSTAGQIASAQAAASPRLTRASPTDSIFAWAPGKNPTCDSTVISEGTGAITSSHGLHAGVSLAVNSASIASTSAATLATPQVHAPPSVAQSTCTDGVGLSMAPSMDQDGLPARADCQLSATHQRGAAGALPPPQRETAPGQIINSVMSPPQSLQQAGAYAGAGSVQSSGSAAVVPLSFDQWRPPSKQGSSSGLAPLRTNSVAPDSSSTQNGSEQNGVAGNSPESSHVSGSAFQCATIHEDAHPDHVAAILALSAPHVSAHGRAGTSNGATAPANPTARKRTSDGSAASDTRSLHSKRSSRQDGASSLQSSSAAPKLQMPPRGHLHAVRKQASDAPRRSRRKSALSRAFGSPERKASARAHLPSSLAASSGRAHRSAGGGRRVHQNLYYGAPASQTVPESQPPFSATAKALRAAPADTMATKPVILQPARESTWTESSVAPEAASPPLAAAAATQAAVQHARAASPAQHARKAHEGQAAAAGSHHRSRAPPLRSTTDWRADLNLSPRPQRHGSTNAQRRSRLSLPLHNSAVDDSDHSHVRQQQSMPALAHTLTGVGEYSNQSGSANVQLRSERLADGNQVPVHPNVVGSDDSLPMLTDESCIGVAPLVQCLGEEVQQQSDAVLFAFDAWWCMASDNFRFAKRCWS